MKSIAICILFFTLNSVASANEKAKVIYIFQNIKIGKQTQSQAVPAALVNMDDVFDEAGSNCSQFIGLVKIEGIQFSESGATLESFRFTDKNGAQWSVPTNIGNLSNADRSTANSFIKVGKVYFSHIQACGSGGYASLINLYNSSIRFGP